MKRCLPFVVATLLCAAGPVRSALADSVTYNILDIADFPDYRSGNSAQTFTGTGFVGMYNDRVNRPEWVHLFGLEDNDYSRTLMQVDISALAGKAIDGAFLQFLLLDGDPSSQTVVVTSFDANGVLSYQWDPTTPLGSASYSVVGFSANSLDVTGLLADRVASGASWLGLHLRGTDQFQYTYTYPGFGYGADSALVRLVVRYSDGVVPEPSSIAMASIGLVGLLGAGVARRRRA